MMDRLARILVAASATIILSGCAATETLGLDDYLPKKDVHYDKVVGNHADRTEPFTQRLRYPVPDDSWGREAASEYSPWTTRR